MIACLTCSFLLSLTFVFSFTLGWSFLWSVCLCVVLWLHLKLGSLCLCQFVFMLSFLLLLLCISVCVRVDAVVMCVQLVTIQCFCARTLRVTSCLRMTTPLLLFLNTSCFLLLLNGLWFLISLMSSLKVNIWWPFYIRCLQKVFGHIKKFMDVIASNQVEALDILILFKTHSVCQT